MWFKNKNTIIKNKNTRCVRHTWKQIFIMLTYANMNMKRTWENYGVRSCFKIGVEQTKRNGGPSSYLYLYRDLAQGSFQGGFCMCIK
jgi:hypothetical protein